MKYAKGETSSAAIALIAIVAILAVGFLVMYFVQQSMNQPEPSGTEIKVQIPSSNPQPDGGPTY